MCNPSDEPIKIYEGTTLGSFEPDIKNSVFVGQVDATSSQATNSESNPALEKLVDEAKVNQAEKQQLQSLLHEFADVFFLARGTGPDITDKALNPQEDCCLW